MPETAIPEATASPLRSERPPTTRGSAVASVGVALPERVVANEEIAARLGVGDSWIESRTGVRERRIADPGERLETYAAEAAERALSNAGVAAAEIDLLLVATMTADEIIPNAAPLVAAELGRERRRRHGRRRRLHRLPVGAGPRLRADRVGPRRARAGDRRRPAQPGHRTATTAAPPRSSPTAPGRSWSNRPRRRGGSGRSSSPPTDAQADLIRVDTDEQPILMNGHDTFKHAVAGSPRSRREAAAQAGLELDDIDLFRLPPGQRRIIAAVGESSRSTPSG